ncbi:hypothetical protein [Acidithiobacillus caldus]|jgi:hypothetical protein|uniref:hypothetical protein n=1 Tax=Acidithiobacillus caldus TaxID=33059 RepID=UPI0013015C94|nr:hypothetical protein [Acidithiobacillus caldus]
MAISAWIALQVAMTMSDQSKGSWFAKWSGLPDKFGAVRLRWLLARGSSGYPLVEE